MPTAVALAERIINVGIALELATDNARNAEDAVEAREWAETTATLASALKILREVEHQDEEWLRVAREEEMGR